MRDRLLSIVKSGFSDFLSGSSFGIDVEDSDLCNDFDRCTEDIVDEILKDKGNLIYDLIVDCLCNCENEPRNGFYPSTDYCIECLHEYQANGVADLFEDCTGESWCTSYDEDRMMWDIHPNGY